MLCFIRRVSPSLAGMLGQVISPNGRTQLGVELHLGVYGHPGPVADRLQRCELHRLVPGS